MKKIVAGFVLMFSLFFLHTSASAQGVNTGNAVADKFLSMLNGTEEAAQSAIAQFASQEVIGNGMIPFGRNPKVSKVEENCVYFSLTDDDETNEYYICTEDDKIVTFEWQD